MDYAKKYNNIVNILQSLIDDGKKKGHIIIRIEDLKNAIPELKESEDEKIRKSLIILLQHFCKGYRVSGLEFAVSYKDMLAWLEKQGEQLYIRFGEIPTDEKSKIYRGETEVGTENGVSVYPAFKTNEGDIVLGLNLPITKTTLYTQQHLLEYDNRPCYLVKGDYIGKDTDGQPLINNVSIIKKIDSYRVKEKTQDEQQPTSDEDKIREWIVRTLKSLNNSSIQIDGAYEMMLPAIAWLEKKNNPQVKTGIEWLNTIDDACDECYAKEYSHGEYCHEQSFKWGFQEGVEWLEKQGESKPIGKLQLSEELYEHIRNTCACIDDALSSETLADINDYLSMAERSAQSAFDMIEKQREKNTADKVEPKFKVGDWVVLNGNRNSIYKVEKIENYHYVLRHILGGIFRIPFDSENSMRPWTIQDAKDGDVLIDAFNSPFIYAGCTDKYAKCYIVFYTNHEYSGLTDFSSPQNWEDKNYVHPATKEQRNLLFAKMKEAGYKWDAEAKQVTKEKSKEEQLDADIDLYYQTYGNGHNAFDGLSLEKFRAIIKQFIEDYR